MAASTTTNSSCCRSRAAAPFERTPFFLAYHFDTSVSAHSSRMAAVAAIWSNAWRAMGSWCGGSEVRIIAAARSAMRTSEPSDTRIKILPESLRFRSSQTRSPHGGTNFGIGTPALSVPFRCEAVIGEPAPWASHLEDLVHLRIRQFEIEDVHVFRKPLDLRRPRDCRDILLNQPAQAHLRRRLAVGLPDPRQC